MKIAIFSNWHHNSIGGVETYVRYLLKTLHEQGHEVIEYYTLKPGKESKKACEEFEFVQSINATSLFNAYRFKANRILKETIDDETIDIIINNTTLTNEKALKSNKVIHVQHINWDSYERKSDKFKKTLDRFFFGIRNTKKSVKIFKECCFFYKRRW